MTFLFKIFPTPKALVLLGIPYGKTKAPPRKTTMFRDVRTYVSWTKEHVCPSGAKPLKPMLREAPPSDVGLPPIVESSFC